MNNYLNKYTLIPIVEDDNIICFIVSKCYLIYEIKDYDNDIININYYIVYPYEIDSMGYLKSIEPMFDENNICINGIVTNELYDSYEDALSAKKIKDYYVFSNIVSKMDKKDIKENYENIRVEHINKLNRFNNLQSLLLINRDNNYNFYNKKLINYIKH